MQQEVAAVVQASLLLVALHKEQKPGVQLNVDPKTMLIIEQRLKVLVQTCLQNAYQSADNSESLSARDILLVVKHAYSPIYLRMCEYLQWRLVRHQSAVDARVDAADAMDITQPSVQGNKLPWDTGNEFDNFVGTSIGVQQEKEPLSQTDALLANALTRKMSQQERSDFNELQNQASCAFNKPSVLREWLQMNSQVNSAVVMELLGLLCHELCHLLVEQAVAVGQQVGTRNQNNLPQTLGNSDAMLEWRRQLDAKFVKISPFRQVDDFSNGGSTGGLITTQHVEQAYEMIVEGTTRNVSVKVDGKLMKIDSHRNMRRQNILI